MDAFAQIAANGIGGREDELAPQDPPVYTPRYLDLAPDTAAFPTPDKMHTPEELRAALAGARARFAPFLADLSPKLEQTRTVIGIREFDLDGTPVTIPHFSGPTGPHKQVYTAEFISPDPEGYAACFCCGGADYKAVVYVNGTCVGTHEGIFSPFTFPLDGVIRAGSNTLRIELYNDCVFLGNPYNGEAKCEGDKLYAATGPGWDDAAVGWHHCPPGMGITGNISVELRPRIHISDLYVRPLADLCSAEAWVEVDSADYGSREIELDLSLYGQNFPATVFEHFRYVPGTVKTVGRGDSLTEAAVKDQIGKSIPMPLGHGTNVLKVTFGIPGAKIWEPDTPYLYRLQVRVVNPDGSLGDAQSLQFGMRSFTQDLESEPKGMFRLNGRPVRLRGANTMGFEQQDVMRGDYDQLIDDILLAKLCRMNFLRLTQRPVQEEIYRYCDRLGLMTQCDLPLFGCMRRTKLCEGVRQAEEMERHVRKHPCNIAVTYINEPFPNANNEPHRHLTRPELENFFSMCDMAIHMQNPDRVIKHVDGDYDPPTEGMPDNHCYPMWYNGHGIDIGRLHKGYWMSVKPGWYYGCGEYGAEGLDYPEVMRERYPKEWLREPFDPKNIVGAQTGSFHYFFYDTPEGLENWVSASQSFQAFATKIMTEAFRRDDRMISDAIHLFIDAWPAGWMKTIMDCRRNPKQAYFAYRDALAPVMLSLRTDRFSYFAGEEVLVEAWLCNDTDAPEDGTLRYELYRRGESAPVMTGEIPASVCACHADYAATVRFCASCEGERTGYTLKAVFVGADGAVRDYNAVDIDVFADVGIPENDDVVLIEKLEPGVHTVAGTRVTVRPCGMLPVHFVSRNTGHPAVAEFEPKDFSYWYDQSAGYITPLLHTTFEAPGFTPILLSGNQKNGVWGPELAAAEKVYEGKRYVICQVDLRTENPVAKRFLKNLLETR